MCGRRQKGVPSPIPVHCCVVCKKRTGKPYTFHYGKSIGKPRQENRFGRSYQIEEYHLAGQKTVLLCDRCIFLRGCAFLFAALFGIYLMNLVIYWMNNSSHASYHYESYLSYLAEHFLLPGMAIICAIAATYALIAYVVSIKQRSFFNQLWEIGEKIAIHLRRKSLKRLGYNTCFTTKEYEKLEKHQTSSS
jgi:hypothetical protein